MRIGELARRAGTSARTLRYYEQHGLLLARRQPNGYREYDEAEVRLAREIRTLLGIGFGLEEIRPLVDCLRSGVAVRQACPGISGMYRRKLAELDAVIGRLQTLRGAVARELAGLADRSGRVDPEDRDRGGGDGVAWASVPRRTDGQSHGRSGRVDGRGASGEGASDRGRG
jgi:DNA-binding transcriptional MerR regulator